MLPAFFPSNHSFRQEYPYGGAGGYSPYAPSPIASSLPFALFGLEPRPAHQFRILWESMKDLPAGRYGAEWLNPRAYALNVALRVVRRGE